eukprot:15450631-Alexandrium_andersonii.AAC.1
MPLLIGGRSSYRPSSRRERRPFASSRAAGTSGRTRDATELKCIVNPPHSAGGCARSSLAAAPAALSALNWRRGPLYPPHA